MNLNPHRFNNNCKREAAPGAEGGTVTEGQPGADNQMQPDNQNNSENNVDPFAGMWDNPDSAANTNAAAPPANAPPVQTPQEIFDDHFDSLRIGDGLDMAAVVTDIQNGGVEQLADFGNRIAKDVYRALLTQTNKLMDNKVETAMDKAVNRSSGEFNANLATRELNSALPFTADKAVKPIADGVFAQFIKAGKSVTESIELTGQYFTHTFKLGEKELGLKPPAQRPGANGFGTAPTADEEDAPDWLKILGG